MIDFGFDKIALIGAVALIVIGPEKLPKVARTIGHLFGKAQRYAADVRAEVNRSIELDELKKMKTDFETAARDVQQSVSSEINSATSAFQKDWTALSHDVTSGTDLQEPHDAFPESVPDYKHPGKNWRLKRGATPQWYKHKNGIRTRALSGAARVARFRPPGVKGPR
jgi:sec-independent protein translocase protein TatB